MEYILIKKTNFQEFNDDINRKLENGWKLHNSNFSRKIVEKLTIYTQVMFKKSENKIDTVEQILASWNVT